MFRIVELPGKGAGCVASEKIHAGTLVLSESPIIEVPQYTYHEKNADLFLHQLAKLDNHEKRAFFALRNNFKDMRPIEGIVKTNAMPLGKDSPYGGIFLGCSRFNHSCTANAAYHWNADARKERVFAIRQIDAGEEITVSYLSDDVWALPRLERKKQIVYEFGFDCHCGRCEDCEEIQQLGSDKRRTRLAEIDQNVGDGMLILLNPSKALRLCREALNLFDLEREAAPRLEAVYYDASQICVCHGDLARATVFASRAADAKRSWQGKDAPGLEDTEALAQNPESHPSAHQSKMWFAGSKRASKTPSWISEEWLWRRAG